MKTAVSTRTKPSKSKASENHALLKTLIAFKNGNFAVRMPVDQIGIEGKIADALNDILDLNQKMAKRVRRASAGRSARKARSRSGPPSDRRAGPGRIASNRSTA